MHELWKCCCGALVLEADVSAAVQQAGLTYDVQTFLTNWFNAHAAAAHAVGKPLVLEEFGKAVNVSLLLCMHAAVSQRNLLAE